MSRQLIFTHFTNNHRTDEQNLPTRFVCQVCGLPGVGLRHSCPSCSLILHRYCQQKGGDLTSTCFLHPQSSQTVEHNARLEFGKTVPCCQAIIGFFIDQVSRCILCGDKISVDNFRYVCDNDPTCIAHPTCFLVQKKTAFPFKGPVVDASGHELHQNHEGGSYTCATCGDRGFGLSLCNKSRHHHPFCVESSRLKRKRKCFRHNDSNHGMDWTPPPPFWNRPICWVCQRKIVGHHYLCCSTEDSRAIHPMCAERLRQDRNYGQIRDAGLKVGGYVVEGLTLGTVPLATGGRGRLHRILASCRRILLGVVGLPSI